MKNIILMLLAALLLLGCATTGMNIHKTPGDSSKYNAYESTDITISCQDLAENSHLKVSLSFYESQTLPNWGISLHCPDQYQGHDPVLMFVVDEEIFIYDYYFIDNNNFAVSVNEGMNVKTVNYNFPLETNLFKSVLFADEIRILVSCNGNKFEGVLSENNKSDFSLFYNYIKRNVIENKTLVLKA